MSKHFARALGAVATVFAAIVVMAPVAQAKTPRPGYEQFAGCPSPISENPRISACIRYTFTGGHINLGKLGIPISNPITLSGGVDPLLGNFSTSPKGGLEVIKEPVPGGLIGSTRLNWLSGVLNAKQLMLYAVIELAGTPAVGLQEIQLPVKVHLINSVLGNSCYVGSNSNPIVLNLTTGTTNPPAPNKPISGTEPIFSVDQAREIFILSDGIFVDNSFAAPGANGCVLRLLGGALSLNVSSLLNARAGLPARAGTNEVTVDDTTELAAAESVYSQE